MAVPTQVPGAGLGRGVGVAGLVCLGPLGILSGESDDVIPIGGNDLR